MTNNIIANQYEHNPREQAVAATIHAAFEVFESLKGQSL